MVTQLKKPPRNVNLKARRNRSLARATLGGLGYGFPARLKGYRLVGQSKGRLEKLFDRNDHPKVDPGNLPLLDWEDLVMDRKGSHLIDRFLEIALDNPNHGWIFVNRWEPRNYLAIMVWRNEQSGAYIHIPQKRHDQPFFLLMRSFTVRMRATSGKAESKAREKLLEQLNGRQKRELLETGCFEAVGKSGMRYLIRQGRPTVAFREQKMEGQRMIEFRAVLCYHPLGYYEETFTGSMPPSDEMLAHLLAIRADEHFYWRKANQHGLDDPRSGL